MFILTYDLYVRMVLVKCLEASAVSDLEGLVDVRQRLCEIEQEEERLSLQKREAETVKAEKAMDEKKRKIK